MLEEKWDNQKDWDSPPEHSGFFVRMAPLFLYECGAVFTLCSEMMTLFMSTESHPRSLLCPKAVEA